MQYNTSIALLHALWLVEKHALSEYKTQKTHILSFCVH